MKNGMAKFNGVMVWGAAVFVVMAAVPASRADSVLAWGGNNSGQLGLGHNSDTNRPTVVPGLSGVKQLSAGEFYTVALMINGTVRAWGHNAFGQLGLGHTVNTNRPTVVPGLAGVRTVVVGSSVL